MRAAFPDKVITTATAPKHVFPGVTTGIVTEQLVDWYLMGMADAFILGGFSIYGRAAAFRTGWTNSIFTATRKGNCEWGRDKELMAKVNEQMKAAYHHGKRVDATVFEEFASTCDCSKARGKDPKDLYSGGAGI